jgi:hypothetical protein
VNTDHCYVERYTNIEYIIVDTVIVFMFRVDCSRINVLYKRCTCLLGVGNIVLITVRRWIGCLVLLIYILTYLLSWSLALFFVIVYSCCVYQWPYSDVLY